MPMQIPEPVRLAAVVVPLAGVGALHFPPKTVQKRSFLSPRSEYTVLDQLLSNRAAAF